MLMTGKRVQITQLPDSDHADKIFLMPRQRNLIGFWHPQLKTMGTEPERQKAVTGKICVG
jgi:hypothetical protein